MIFHLALNSFLVFFLLSIAIEFLLFAFQIKNARIRYLCRMLCVIKLPFDLIMFSAYGENLFLNFNPFSCEMYTQDFIISILPATIKADISPNDQLLIPQYLASLLPPFLLQIIIAVLSIATTILFLRKAAHFFSYRSYLKHVLKASAHCQRKITHPKLKKTLKEANALVMISKEVRIPFAADNRYIIIPELLSEDLSQEEFEAVVSHELEHLRWKDPQLKVMSSIICAFFWWIPTKWWIKRLESDQEQASDFSVHRYDVDPCALASALMKAVRQAKYQKIEVAAFCPLDSSKGTHFIRFENLLKKRKPSHHFAMKSVMAIFGSLIAFLSLWIC